MHKLKHKLIAKIEALADRPKRAAWVLGSISFAESSFFPIPPDILLMPLVALRPKRWWWFATVTTVASVVGALAGYLIGALLFEFIGTWVVETYHLQDELILVQQSFDNNAALAMFTSAFTPIPFKVFTIAGGVFGVNIWVFTIASLIGRGARFFIEALLMKVFGPRLVKSAMKYFNIATVLVILLVVAYILIKR